MWYKYIWRWNDDIRKNAKKLDEAEDYCYQLPIYRNGKTYVYTVGKGGPVREDIREYLTDDEIKELKVVKADGFIALVNLLKKKLIILKL